MRLRGLKPIESSPQPREPSVSRCVECFLDCSVCRALVPLRWWPLPQAPWPTPPSSPACCWHFPVCFGCRFVAPSALASCDTLLGGEDRAAIVNCCDVDLFEQLSLACVKGCCGRCCGRSSSSRSSLGGVEEEFTGAGASLLPRPGPRESPSHLTSVRASWSYRYITFMESFPAVVIGGMLAAR